MPYLHSVKVDPLSLRELSKTIALVITRTRTMKPVVGPLGAWFCTLLSIFAIVILSIIGLMFYKGHETMMGSINDPEDGKAVARTVFAAVGVYAVFLVFCGSQVFINSKQKRVSL